MTKEQLGDLILTSEDTMYHVAKTILYCDMDCADAIQETIVKAFSHIETLKNDKYGKTWLIRILINECYSILRKVRKVVSIEEYPVELVSEEPEDYSDLYEAISHLPEEVRICVTLYYMEDMSIKEIAEVCKTTESAVKKRLARARKKLRDELEPQEVMG